MSRRRGKPPGNPAARPLSVIAIATLLICGTAAAFDLDAVLAWTAKPLVLLCMLAVIAYTAVAIHLGWIAVIGHLGRVEHYERARQPVMFWTLALVYLGVCGSTAGYMATLLLR